MPSRPPGGPGLTLRALNRATLQRQLLLERTEMGVVDAVQQLGGLQAQIPLVPYTTLWSRLDPFEPTQVATALIERRLVRTPTMRSTVHLLSTSDAVAWRPHLHAPLARAYGSTAWAKQLRTADTDAIVAAGRELLEHRPLPRAELGRQLVERFPGLDAESMAIACTYLLPVLQVPPRGVWGKSGQATWTTYEAWLGRQVEQVTPSSLEQLLMRYLAGFGPASVKDVQAWSGLTRLREVADRLGDRLRRYRTEEGIELFDLVDAELPDPDTPAPVRFLAEYDNAQLGYADRRRILPDVEHRWVSGGPGGAIGTVLVDGFVQATWTLRRPDRATARLELHPSTPIEPAQRAAVEEEAAGLLDFLAAGADHDVLWTGVRVS